MSESTTVRGFRVSLRELLVLSAALAGGCAALKYANEWWQTGVAAVTLIVLMSTGVVALIDRGARQARAIAFVACALGYGLLVHQCRTITPMGNGSGTTNSELNPYDGGLPTTRLLRPVYEQVAEPMWMNHATGKLVPESQVPANQRNGYMMSGGMGGFGPGAPSGGGGMSGAGGAPTYSQWGQRPQYDHFMTVGHCLWALLLGYVGGKFAEYVYARRVREASTAAG